MFSFFKRNKKETDNMSYVPKPGATGYKPSPPSARTGVQRPQLVQRTYTSNNTSNYDSGPDIVDNIIAAEIVSSIADSSSSYDSGSSYDSSSSSDSYGGFDGGGGSFDGGGASGDW